MRRILSSAPYAIGVAFYLFFTLRAGTPALRHDWLWPIQVGGLEERFAQLGFGWDAEGVGRLNPYPMTYPIAGALGILALAVGSRATLVVLGTGIALAVTHAGVRTARLFGLGTLSATALAGFLLLNPFTYTKLVAGHLTQTLSYAGFVLLGVELLERKPESRRLILAVFLTALQTQFFLIALGLCCTRMRNREVRLSALVGVAVFLPSLIGIALDARDLLSWPFTVAWENDQSVSLVDGFLLNGFFAGYAQAFRGLGALGIALYLALALGAGFARNLRVAVPVAACGIATLLVASGTKGPLGALWRWAIVHAPVVGVYRELYDLIGVVAAAYAILAAATMARYRWSLALAVGGTIALGFVWALAPPDRYWVAAETLPAPGPTLSSVSRYALIPGYQPLSFLGRGSGADPLMLGTSPGNSAVNAMLVDYPVDRALTEFERTGETTDLARLGVELVECRPGMEESEGALAFYDRNIAKAATCSHAEVRIAKPAPLVAVEDSSRLCALCSAAGAGNRFIGDVAGKGWFRSLPLARVDVDPARGWVDVRLLFAKMPELAEPLGGVYTTRDGVPLSLPPGPFVLTNVDHGNLRSIDGRMVSGVTRGYRWVRLPPGTTAITCRGSCAVVGVGDPHGTPLDPPAPAANALASRIVTPFLVIASIPAGVHGVLRFLEAYDDGWVGIRSTSLSPLAHVRLDAFFNGWQLPPADESQVVLFHLTSILQILGGIVGIATTIFVVAREARRS